MMTRAGAPRLMGEINKALILNALRLQGDLSRADLARATNLTIPTISRQVNTLIEEGFVQETELGQVPLGKPPMMLELISDGRVVIGVDLTDIYIEAAIINLRGEVSHFQRNKIGVQLGDLDDVCVPIAESVRPLIEQTPPEQLLGVGISVPGVVDSDLGKIIYTADQSWKDIPVLLKQRMEEMLGQPVTVNARMRARALGELFYGGAQNVRNFMWVYAGIRGLGAGLVINGQIYPGQTYGAGEIGHKLVASDPDGPVCSFCGKRGCLSTYASRQAVLRRAQEAAAAHPDSLLAQQPAITLKTIINCIEQGDPVAIDFAHETGVYLGLGLADYVHLLNPSHLYLGGSVSLLGEPFIEAVSETTHTNVMEPYRHFSVSASTLGRYAPTIGAATPFFRDLFEPPK